MKKSKSFDCIAMKRAAALRIYEETKDMSLDEELAYWRERSREFEQYRHRVLSESQETVGGGSDAG